MSSGGGGTTTQTVQSGPPQAFIDSYQNVNNRAQQVAQTPYQAYPGQTVAGLSPDQQAGISTIQSANGVAQPYINTAAQYINNSTKPLWDSTQQFSPEAVAQYQSPYTKNVVDTTRQLFNEQNQEQQQGVIGDAISRGAWGGDRSAVAQGILARNQQLAQAPVLAGLENQGYSQALQEFNQQQGAQLGANQANAWLNSQAGAGYANLGNQALQSTLAGGNALLGIGNLEQAQAQAELNVPYQQWQAAQAYPFQTTSWLANIAEGLGGASGGTSSTTAPGPNVGSQIAGAGIAGIGALGQSGAFGSNGWLSSAFGSGGGADISGEISGGLNALGYGMERGGGIAPRRAAGGIAGEPPFGTHIPDLEVSIIPGADGLSVNPGHSGANLLSQSTGSTTTGQGPDTTGQQAGQAIGAIASIAALAFSDRRLKEDVAHVGWLKDGTPVHRYRYKGNPQWHIGVIAQEAEKNHPDAVHETPHGIKMVDNKALTDDSAGRGILQFPHNRTRMGRGILAANDDSGNPVERRRAAGGGIAVSIEPGSYAGSPGVPMISGGGGGGGAPTGGGGIGAVTDYLAAQKSGGHFEPPAQTFDVSQPVSQLLSEQAIMQRVWTQMFGRPPQGYASGGGIAPGRAPGGVTVSLVPGSYKGSPSVPMLGGANAGIIAPSTGLGGIGAVNDYLAAQKAGAHFGLPQTYVPPPIMQAMGVPSASGDGGGGGGGGWSAPAGGGLEGGGGGASGEGGGGGTAGGDSQGGVGGNDVGGGAGAGADYGGSGAGDQGSNDSGGGDSEGSEGSESARGGIVARRDDGGVLDLDLSGGGDPWQSDAPALGAAAGDLPALEDYVPTPLANNAAVDIPQGGNAPQRRGIVAAPPPSGGGSEPADNQPGIDPNAQIVGGYSKSSDSDSGSGGSDWGKALLYTGLGIMGGRSPHALTNVGAGALEGLKLYDQDKYRQELAKYREDNLRSLQGARETSAAVKERGADLNAAKFDWKKQYDTAYMAAKNRGLDDNASDKQARQEVARARLAISGGNAAERGRHNLATEGNQQQKTWDTADWRKQQMDLRREVFNAAQAQLGVTNDQKAQDALQRKINGMSAAAQKQYLAGKQTDLYGNIKYTKTLEQAAKEAETMRDRATEQAGGAQAPATQIIPDPPVGTVEDGYKFKGGSKGKYPSPRYNPENWVPAQ